MELCEMCPAEATEFVSGVGDEGQGAYRCKPCPEVLERSKTSYDLKDEEIETDATEDVPMEIQTLLRSVAASTNIQAYQRERMLFAADVIDTQQREIERLSAIEARAHKIKGNRNLRNYVLTGDSGKEPS